MSSVYSPLRRKVLVTQFMYFTLSHFNTNRTDAIAIYVKKTQKLIYI